MNTWICIFSFSVIYLLIRISQYQWLQIQTSIMTSKYDQQSPIITHTLVSSNTKHGRLRIWNRWTNQQELWWFCLVHVLPWQYYIIQDSSLQHSLGSIRLRGRPLSDTGGEQHKTAYTVRLQLTYYIHTMLQFVNRTMTHCISSTCQTSPVCEVRQELRATVMSSICTACRISFRYSRLQSTMDLINLLNYSLINQ